MCDVSHVTHTCNESMCVSSMCVSSMCVSSMCVSSHIIYMHVWRDSRVKRCVTCMCDVTHGWHGAFIQMWHGSFICDMSAHRPRSCTTSAVMDFTTVFLLQTSFVCRLVSTGWRRLIGCLILIGHFLRKSPIISGSFAKVDLRLRASYESSPLCIRIYVSYLSTTQMLQRTWKETYKRDLLTL